MSRMQKPRQRFFGWWAALVVVALLVGSLTLVVVDAKLTFEQGTILFGRLAIATLILVFIGGIYARQSLWKQN